MDDGYIINDGGSSVDRPWKLRFIHHRTGRKLTCVPANSDKFTNAPVKIIINWNRLNVVINRRVMVGFFLRENCTVSGNSVVNSNRQHLPILYTPIFFV